MSGFVIWHWWHLSFCDPTFHHSVKYSAVFSIVTSLNYELMLSRWNTIEIDGHDVEQVCRAFYEANECKDRPTAILAKTYKGKGVPGKISLLSLRLNN